MTKIRMINLAIDALRRVANEYYGWSAKIHPEDRQIWDDYQATIAWLDDIKKKEKSKKNGHSNRHL